MSTGTTPASTAREELGRFSGTLIGPEDADYDEARKVFNAMIDKRPALIARCAEPRRRRRGRRLRPRPRPAAGRPRRRPQRRRAGDLRRRRRDRPLAAASDVEVDPQARTVRVGGGCTWGEVDHATNEHGLATPSGIISTTGVGGLTLGGGLGHLTRKCGLAIDNLLEADVVLASGERVRASADENPDLFWAIRGGGGNFGVVTSFLFRLHEVGTVVAGPTFWPVEQGAEVLSAYRDFLPNAPRELNGFFAFDIVPPGPPFPEELHLRKVCGVVWCYAGADEEAAARRWRRCSTPSPSRCCTAPAPMPYPAIQSAFDELYPPGDQWYWRADFVKEIPDEAVEIHAQFGAEMPTWKSTMHMYPIDGAAHDVGPSDTAWSYRDAHLGRGVRRRRPRPGERRRDPALERRLLGGAAPVLRRRRVREHDDGRGPGAGPRQLPRQLRPPRADQGRRTTRTTSSASTRTSSRRRRAHHGRSGGASWRFSVSREGTFGARYCAGDVGGER